MNKETKIIGALGAATLIIIIGGALLLGNPNGGSSSTPAPIVIDSQLLNGESAYVKGSKEAKVQIVEFFDFQCPGCGSVAPVVEAISNDYSQDVAIIARNFPLTFHKNAIVAALAAEAAGKQDKYWEMYHILFSKQDQWSEASDAKDKFVGYAKDIGLNEDQFKKDMDDQGLKDKIEQDTKDGISLGVDSTPTFFINGVKYNKVFSYDQLKEVVTGLLQ